MADFASDGNYPAGPDDWSGQPRIVTLTGSERNAGFTPDEPVAPEILNGLHAEIDAALKPIAARYLLTPAVYASNTPVAIDETATGCFESGLTSTATLAQIVDAGYYQVDIWAELKHAGGSTNFIAGLKVLENSIGDQVLNAFDVRYSGTAAEIFTVSGSSLYYLDAGQTLQIEGGSGSGMPDSAIEVIRGFFTIHRLPYRTS